MVARHEGGIMKCAATRATVIQALGVLVLLLIAQPAWSAPPPRPDKTLCDFPVLIQASGDQGQRTQLPGGVLIFSGQQTVTVTNVNTGESATYNTSGPTQFDPVTQEVTLLGSSLVLGPKGSTATGDGFLIQTKGQVSFVLNEPIESQVGTFTDVCADLA
jgi:hypothetical protein